VAATKVQDSAGRAFSHQLSALSTRCYFCNFSAKRGEVTQEESIPNYSPSRLTEQARAEVFKELNETTIWPEVMAQSGSLSAPEIVAILAGNRELCRLHRCADQDRSLRNGMTLEDLASDHWGITSSK
jgi:hypothetical protein